MSVSSFGKFGMGYATLHGNTWQDELFIANRNTLAKLNTTTFQVENIGPLPSQSELTGNALGELWGVFPLETPAQIMELDRSSGQPQRSITLTFMPSPMNIDTFAFATWGGDFYVFLRLYGMGEYAGLSGFHYRFHRGLKQRDGSKHRWRWRFYLRTH